MFRTIFFSLCFLFRSLLVREQTAAKAPTVQAVAELTDVEQPLTERTLEDLSAAELVRFRQALWGEVSGLVTGHGDMYTSNDLEALRTEYRLSDAAFSAEFKRMSASAEAQLTRLRVADPELSERDAVWDLVAPAA